VKTLAFPRGAWERERREDVHRSGSFPRSHSISPADCGERAQVLDARRLDFRSTKGQAWPRAV
ncbi:MAG: hypothetical protein WCG31_03385, partial [Deltaproteobacteria bacterium]